MLYGYENRFFAGMLITAAVALCALALALALGLAGAAMKTSANRLARSVAAFYTTVIRGTPELLVILLVYFDLQRALNAARESLDYADVWIIPPFWGGVIGIGFYYGAYMTETFRGAILAVPRGQTEAAASLGIKPFPVWLRVIIPQMMRHALPGISNNWLVLLKATALVSVIGLSDDMMAVAGQAKNQTRDPFLFYLAVAAGYLFFTALSDAAFGKLRKIARRGL